MKLTRITFTGADDSVDPAELAKISADYPYVEWGILFSLSNQGAPRYPSLEWLTKLQDVCAKTRLPLSAHLCGRYVRDFVVEGVFSWQNRAPELSNIFQRVQLNFHNQWHRAGPSFVDYVVNPQWTLNAFQFILQCDGVNDYWARGLAQSVLDNRLVPLFDASGGAGLIPAKWPEAWPGFYCGYAGGLGPETVVDEIYKIAVGGSRVDAEIWIDMERRVRSFDDREFNLAKVVKVLELTKGIVNS